MIGIESRGMTEFWVEVNIIPLGKSIEEILTTAVKSVIDQLKGQIVTWHFLREFTPINKSHIRFRMRTQQETQLSAVRMKIESVLTPLKGNDIEDFYYGNSGTPESPTNKYQGEEVSYGVKAWQLMQKMMECTSNNIIDLLIKRPIEIPENNYAERCIHFFLNQMGYNRYQEASLHHELSIGNLLIVFGVTQRLNEFETLKNRYYARFPSDRPQ